MKIRIGILGYGNLGRGVESAIKQNKDMELVGVFTRRDPLSVKIQSNATVYDLSALETMSDDIDVLIMCGGSANDLPAQTPKYASLYNVVDSFDTHAKIPEHFTNVDKVSKATQHVSLISAGWDPGLFSLMRVYGESILPNGATYTFWGKGVSQGHSDTLRRIEGVIDARQYTIPVESALKAVRDGEQPTLTTREKHTRECFVVVEENADKTEIEKTIVTMPNYFDEYDTTVHFITNEELQKNHAGIPHGGMVFRSGKTGWDERQNEIIEFKLTLDSNPEFTASVLVAYARAVHRLAKEKQYGCKTVLDIAPSYLSLSSDEELRKNYL